MASYASGPGPYWLTMADLNHDNYPDAVVPNNGGRSLLLGISYGKSNSSDEIMHSNKIVLLDREGAVKAEVEGLAGETDSLADAAS